MRGAKRAAQSRRRRRHALARGIPAALLGIGVLTCLVLAFLPGGGPADAGRAVAAAQAAAAPGAEAAAVPPGSARAVTASARPSHTGAAADGNGACLFGPTNDLMVAAMNYTDYESSKASGAVSPHGSGCGGPVRITDIPGQQLTVDRMALRPNVAQVTSVQFARH